MHKTPREIGGYLELERFGGREYHDGALALNCARNCLVYLIGARGIGRVWVPAFLCSSVSAAARAAGAEVLEYEVTPDLLPDYGTVSLGPGDYLYFVDYYGQATDEAILDAARRSGGRLVVDEVQGFFRRPLPGIDTLYCCRKFFGVPDGAYLYTTATPDGELERDLSAGRMRHLLGRFEGTASDYYADYAANDRAFAGQPVRLMSELTHNLLRGIDYERAAETRERNFRYLDERLGAINALSPSVPRGAYMYPLLLDHGARETRLALQRRRVYVPTLWPNAAEAGGVTGRLARDILPLPVDQRYDTDDMALVCDLLEEVRG